MSFLHLDWISYVSGLHPTKFDPEFRGAHGGGVMLDTDGLGSYGPKPSTSNVFIVSTCVNYTEWPFFKSHQYLSKRYLHIHTAGPRIVHVIKFDIC